MMWIDTQGGGGGGGGVFRRHKIHRCIIRYIIYLTSPYKHVHHLFQQ